MKSLINLERWVLFCSNKNIPETRWKKSFKSSSSPRLTSKPFLFNSLLSKMELISACVSLETNTFELIIPSLTSKIWRNQLCLGVFLLQGVLAGHLGFCSVLFILILYSLNFKGILVNLLLPEHCGKQTTDIVAISSEGLYLNGFYHHWTHSQFK